MFQSFFLSVLQEQEQKKSTRDLKQDLEAEFYKQIRVYTLRVCSCLRTWEIKDCWLVFLFIPEMFVCRRKYSKRKNNTWYSSIYIIVFIQTKEKDLFFMCDYNKQKWKNIVVFVCISWSKQRKKPHGCGCVFDWEETTWCCGCVYDLKIRVKGLWWII